MPILNLALNIVQCQRTAEEIITTCCYWIDNLGNRFVDNLGNRIYFNKAE